MPRERVRYQDRIIEDPTIMMGKPVVKGTGIHVEKVLDQLAYKPDLEELFAIYPELTMEDVKACLAYARSVVAQTSGLLRGSEPRLPEAQEKIAAEEAIAEDVERRD